MIGPVIRLKRLTDEELFALLDRVTKLYSQNYNWQARITEEEKQRFLSICLERAGADLMITPREMLRDYMTVLNILMQNEEATFDDIVGSGAVTLKHEEKQNVSDNVSAPNPQRTNSFDPNDIEF